MVVLRCALSERSCVPHKRVFQFMKGGLCISYAFKRLVRCRRQQDEEDCCHTLPLPPSTPSRAGGQWHTDICPALGP